MASAPAASSRATARRPAALGTLWPFLLLGLLALALPLIGDDYWGIIATRACVYWILVSGLNLVVGFAGQLAIGWVSLLAIGAYAASILAVYSVLGAFAAAAAAGALCGAILGLPALRLRTFYFAMTTLGFATIVTQIALAWMSVTGGGAGLPGPALPASVGSGWGLYFLCLAIAALCTWMTLNVASSRFGRALVALRDAEVAAEAAGISKAAMLITVFLFSGATAGISGGLFATLQSYITPDAFSFDLSVLFFIAILIGGRGSVLGPLLGTILLTVLPEFAAPLVAWSTFLYAALLLVVVLVLPGGIADLLDARRRRRLDAERAIIPQPSLLAALLETPAANRPALSLRGIVLSYGGVRAIDGLDLDLRPGEVHGIIGPNGSGKTTALNVISGFARPQAGDVWIGRDLVPGGSPQKRAALGIARTFQTPRSIGEASVLENVMVGGTIEGSATFAETLLTLPRHRRDEDVLRRQALHCLRIVGLEDLAEERADRLQHSELRFLEIARALMLKPSFLLLDEPAAGLSPGEIERLGALIRGVCERGTGVLLVEHHADLVFAVCDRITVLNLGRELAAGTPREIQAHREVVSVYLGA